MEMSLADFAFMINEYFQHLWRLFDIEIPFLGMKISHFAIGFFIVLVGIKCLKAGVMGGKE